MKRTILVLGMFLCVPALAAPEKPATEATLQAVNSGIQQLNSEFQTANSNLIALNGTVQNLANEIHTDYGGLEYVLMAIAQAIYFSVGLALFYIFDRGRLARDIW